MFVDIVSAEKVDGYIQIIKEITDDDSNVSLNTHLMREDTVEWRAAEYGFDPETEWDDLINFLVYEPFFPPGTKLLYDYDTQAEAKAGVMQSTNNVMEQLAPPPPEVQPLVMNGERTRKEETYEVLKTLAIVGIEELEMKAGYIRKVFDSVKQSQRQTAQSSTPRGEDLRKVLEGLDGHKTRSENRSG